MIHNVRINVGVGATFLTVRTIFFFNFSSSFNNNKKKKKEISRGSPFETTTTKNGYNQR